MSFLSRELATDSCKSDMANGRLAYLHILLSSRLPSLDQQYLSSGSVSVDEVKNDFGEFLPFLVDTKSTVRYESVREAWTDVWERIGRSIVRSVSCFGSFS